MIHLITLGLFSLVGISLAIMWKIQFHWERSVFSEIKGRGAIWFSPLGWTLKYKDADPKKGPAFPGSTTIFVWLTDAFHFFQLVAYTSLEAAVVLHGFDVFEFLGEWVETLSEFPTWVLFVLNLAVLKGCRGFLFEITFTYLFDMKFWNKLTSWYRSRFTTSPLLVSVGTLALGFGLVVLMSFLPDPWGRITSIGITGIFLLVLVVVFVRSFLSKPPVPTEESEEETPSS